jgi:hypothetical protein
VTDPTGATADSIVIEDIKEWRGQDVIDSQGEKLGKLEDVYYDTESDAPAFGAIKSGLVGKHITLVPLAGATAGQLPSRGDREGPLQGRSEHRH